jgi:hypothetical protein
MLHQEVGRNHLRSAASKRQDQHESCDTTGLSNAMATISPISVTFSCWPPKIFHNQPVSVQNLLSSSSTDSPQAELPLLVFGQVVLPSWMIFKSEMVGLNDRAAPEFCNVRYGSGDTAGLCTQFPKDLELFIARTSSKRAILILGCGAAQWRH